MVRKLLLASLDWTRPKDPPLSLGATSIAAYLLEKGFKYSLASWSVNDNHFMTNDVVKWVMNNAKENCDFGIGVFIWNEVYVQKILRLLKENSFPGRIILGGPQISYCKAGLLETNYPHGDIFVRGYAERAVSKLLEAKDSSLVRYDIRGVHFANTPDMGFTTISNLETYPSPFLSSIIKPQKFIRWETQRGCPFRCSFCQHREVSSEALARRNFQFNRIQSEISWIGANNSTISDIAVLDPTFNSGPDYLNVVNGLSEVKYTGRLSLQCRVEMVKPEFIDAIERLNSNGATVVLEFGVQTIHHNEFKMINRPNNLKKAVRIFKELHRRGIIFEISLIFGLPLQTLMSFQKSVDWCMQQHPSQLYAFPLMILRGTPLYDAKDTLQLVESYQIAHPLISRIQEGVPHVVSSPSFTEEDWFKMADIAVKISK